MNGRPHSAGGIYGVFNDLHRSVRYLPHNVWACTIPGPKEPSLEQLNHILQPLKDEMMQLYIGMIQFGTHICTIAHDFIN